VSSEASISFSIQYLMVFNPVILALLSISFFVFSNVSEAEKPARSYLIA
jgi:hypothetical protein